jgi:ATP synthase subunit 6
LFPVSFLNKILFDCIFVCQRLEFSILKYRKELEHFNFYSKYLDIDEPTEIQRSLNNYIVADYLDDSKVNEKSFQKFDLKNLATLETLITEWDKQISFPFSDPTLSGGKQLNISHVDLSRQLFYNTLIKNNYRFQGIMSYVLECSRGNKEKFSQEYIDYLWDNNIVVKGWEDVEQKLLKEQSRLKMSSIEPSITTLQDSKLSFDGSMGILKSFEQLKIYFLEYRHNNLEDNGFDSVINQQRKEHILILGMLTREFTSVDKFILKYCSDTSLFKNFFYYVLIRENFIISDVFNALFVKPNEVFYQFYKYLIPDILSQEEKTLRMDYINSVYQSYYETDINPSLFLYRKPLKDLTLRNTPTSWITKEFPGLMYKNAVLDAIKNTISSSWYTDGIKNESYVKFMIKNTKEKISEELAFKHRENTFNSLKDSKKIITSNNFTNLNLSESDISKLPPEEASRYQAFIQFTPAKFQGNLGVTYRHADMSWEANRLALFLGFITYPYNKGKDTNITSPFRLPGWFNYDMPHSDLKKIRKGKHIVEDWYITGSDPLSSIGWPFHNITSDMTGIFPKTFVTYLSEFFNVSQYFVALENDNYPPINIPLPKDTLTIPVSSQPSVYVLENSYLKGKEFCWFTKDGNFLNRTDLFSDMIFMSGSESEENSFEVSNLSNVSVWSDLSNVLATHYPSFMKLIEHSLILSLKHFLQFIVDLSLLFSESTFNFLVQETLPTQLVSIIGLVFCAFVFQSYFLKRNSKNSFEINTKGINGFTYEGGLRLFSTRLIGSFFYLTLLSVNVFYDIVGNSKEVRYHLFSAFYLFFLILLLNLIGLAPFCFCITAQLCVTLFLGLSFFIAINLYSIFKHGLNFFKLFFPQGTSVYLSFLLVPLEIISYMFRPLSIAVRLFANMMAGHTLLAVIAGFAWSMLLSFTFLGIISSIVPTFVCSCLWFLEFGVALIQAYVFCILFCIYVSDAIHLH